MNDATRRDALKLAAAAGLAAATPCLAGGDDKAPDDRWRTWAVTEGSQPRLVVEGIYGHGGPGLVAIVKEATPQGINPKILLLELKTFTLPGVWPAVLQPVPAYYARAPYKKDQYQSVQVRYPTGSMVTIENIVDAGKGP